MRVHRRVKGGGMVTEMAGMQDRKKDEERETDRERNRGRLREKEDR
jgi:hypothetical protein